MSSPIFLTGTEAASYQWNTYQGNLIVKAVKAATSFVKGVLDRFSVSEADARQYVNRTDTQNTYARSILERQIRVIDTINNKVPVVHGGLDKTDNKSEPSNKSAVSLPSSTTPVCSAVSTSTSPAVSYSQSSAARTETTSHPSSGIQSKAFSTTLPARPYYADAPITPRASEAPGSQASSVDGVAVEKIGMDVKQILPLLQMLKMDKTTQTKVIDWFGKVQDLSEKVESGRMSEEAALQMAPELAREFISFLPIRDHLKTGLQNFVLDLVSMIKDRKELDGKSGLEILRKYGQLFYDVSKDCLDNVSRSLELGQSERVILQDTLTCVANIIEIVIRPENVNRPEPELLQEIMPQVLGLISTFPEDVRVPVLAHLMGVFSAGASPQPARLAIQG